MHTYTLRTSMQSVLQLDWERGKKRIALLPLPLLCQSGLFTDAIGADLAVTIFRAEMRFRDVTGIVHSGQLVGFAGRRFSPDGCQKIRRFDGFHLISLFHVFFLSFYDAYLGLFCILLVRFQFHISLRKKTKGFIVLTTNFLSKQFLRACCLFCFCFAFVFCFLTTNIFCPNNIFVFVVCFVFVLYCIVLYLSFIFNHFVIFCFLCYFHSNDNYKTKRDCCFHLNITRLELLLETRERPIVHWLAALLFWLGADWWRFALTNLYYESPKLMSKTSSPETHWENPYFSLVLTLSFLFLSLMFFSIIDYDQLVISESVRLIGVNRILIGSEKGFAEQPLWRLCYFDVTPVISALLL